MPYADGDILYAGSVNLFPFIKRATYTNGSEYAIVSTAPWSSSSRVFSGAYFTPGSNHILVAVDFNTNMKGASVNSNMAQIEILESGTGTVLWESNNNEFRDNAFPHIVNGSQAAYAVRNARYMFFNNYDNQSTFANSNRSAPINVTAGSIGTYQTVLHLASSDSVGSVFLSGTTVTVYWIENIANITTGVWT